MLFLARLLSAPGTTLLAVSKHGPEHCSGEKRGVGKKREKRQWGGNRDKVHEMKEEQGEIGPTTVCFISFPSWLIVQKGKMAKSANKLETRKSFSLPQPLVMQRLVQSLVLAWERPLAVQGYPKDCRGL